ncbi:hypothetical protein BU14_0208s0037 [Porphyra umbilicalis]|uniref:Uncharacterized protein n=1 Tax=Porphyra umbilicalis TaxID=2786 RepID=A0A1X6P5R4_PORUM|nr:hypothetical protein BU14_0208s0037 [Porphyra umbilicalis]|eukprot:OSX76080.1 hypothetical protein BU14_0208s0037 [Porphyra umbilicalis]
MWTGGNTLDDSGAQKGTGHCRQRPLASTTSYALYSLDVAHKENGGSKSSRNLTFTSLRPAICQLTRGICRTGGCRNTGCPTVGGHSFADVPRRRSNASGTGGCGACRSRSESDREGAPRDASRMIPDRYPLAAADHAAAGVPSNSHPRGVYLNRRHPPHPAEYGFGLVPPKTRHFKVRTVHSLGGLVLQGGLYRCRAVR